MATAKTTAAARLARSGFREHLRRCACGGKAGRAMKAHAARFTQRSKQSDCPPSDRSCNSRRARTDHGNAIDRGHDAMPDSPAKQFAPAEVIEIGVRNPELLQR